ncbi:MAG TPA: sulfotransferase [Steroidobacteraceae bacterium]
MQSADTPSPTATHAKLVQEAAKLQVEGKLQDAERVYRAALELDPNHFATLYFLGLICAQQGRADAAVALLYRAAAQNPAVAEVHNNLGVTLQTLGRYEEALQCYSAALLIAPRYAMAHSNLGTTLAALKRNDEALAHLQQALAIEPGNVDALCNLGKQCFLLGRNADALVCFSKVVAARPDSVDAQLALGNAHLALNCPHEALASYKKALALNSRSVAARLLLGDVLQVLERPVEALAEFEHALLVDPRCIEAEMKLGNIQQSLHRYPEALAAYRRALAINPNQARGYDCLGYALAELGDAANARHAFEAALRLEPRRTRSYFALVSSGKLTAEDPHLAAMKKLALDLPALARDQQVFLHFALAKALADIGAHSQSFAHLIEGNALRRHEIVYDEARMLGLFERIRATFTAELMRSKGGHGHSSQQPIFIVGMMRSGSTLVEQMLASHTAVFAAGERHSLQQAVTEVLAAGTERAPFPELVCGLPQESLRAIGASYLVRVDAAQRLSAAPGAHSSSPRQRAPRSTDKLLSNFMLVGLIRLVFPHAHIIHTMRDPIDTCLSCFATLFANHQPHTYELGELGRYYRGYASLMAHWQEVLPTGAMLNVQYEKLVANFEAEARRIIEYCGLEWQSACLAFYRTARPIQTASRAQVREPVYQTSVGRFRPDEDRLRGLVRALGQR